MILDLGDEGVDARHRDEPASRRDATQAPEVGIAPGSTLPRTLSCLPAGFRWAPIAALLLTFTLSACRAGTERGPVPSPPPTAGPATFHGPGSVDAVRDHAAGVVPAAPLAELDELLARVERLASTAVVTRVAAAACVETCAWYGAAELVLEAGRARCVCTRPPDLGRRSVSSVVARVPEEHGQRDPQDVHQEPGAEVEDTRAGLSSEEGPRS